MSPPPRDTQIAALIEAEVLRAMAPYRRLDLAPEVLDELERILRFGLKTHPTAQGLLRQLVEEQVPTRSDTINGRELDEFLEKKKREGG